MAELITILLAGFATGITTVLFGFGGGFVVVPFIYQMLVRQPDLSDSAMHIAVATSTAVMIFNAGWASWQNWRAGRLSAAMLFPLAGYIAIGAVMGSLLAGEIADRTIRLLFMIYMLVTLADCLMRKGFLLRPTRRRLSALTSGVGGVAIGLVAALLGVGGSVMTVPLLRRHGYTMRDCVSAANPLSLPVAVCGAAVYIVSGLQAVKAPGYLGFINLKILALLTLAGWLGILFIRRVVPAVPDALHARVYIALLLAVLVAIVL
ncbi:sulfite exporter TauE/SafE family protein [Erwinia sp. HDF1-3R]|uniref:sulfite exporter TauE/SafE family protein n=1 Tax=Erwinia sp. HDF1-3R TaxID=3141543 RepID=UPI0031F4BD05